MDTFSVLKRVSRPLVVLSLVCLTFVPGLSSAQSYSREDYLRLIRDSVEKTVNIYDGTWAYSYTIRDNIDDQTVTRRVNPTLPFLLSDRIIAENNGPPSQDSLDRHERLMKRRLRRQQQEAAEQSLVDREKAREGSEKERFLNLLIPESLILVKQEGNIHTLEFRGMEEDRRTIYEHLAGTLVLDVKNEYIRELQVRVTEPFSPFLIMRINSGYFSLRFSLRDGIPVQTDATWQLDGHVLYIRNLDRDQEVEWFDLNRVTSAAPD